VSCGTWTAERRNPFGTAAQQLVLGYLAGAADWATLNASAASVSIDPLAGTDAQGAWAWIDRYCWTHPTDQILTAAEAFTIERANAGTRPH
jgi:hypothetical protein